MADPTPVLIAQFTDTQVLAGSIDDLTNDDQLADAVNLLAVESPRPDVLLLTGDLADDALPAQYRVLADELASVEIPMLALPGNHDARDLVRDTFANTPWIDADHASWVTEICGVRIVGLDSTRPGHHGAEFDGERAEWLAEVLSEPHDGATVLAMHHPPFETGIDWMDRSGFVGLDEFVDVIQRTGVVDRIVCGHLHRPVGATVAGVGVQVGLSTACHVALDLEPDNRPSMIADPIGYQLHLVTGRHVVTHTRYVGTGEQAFVPDWADSF